MSNFPVLMHTAIDAPDCRGLAEFYRELLGLKYRPCDEPPTDGSDDDADWLVLVDSQGQRVLTVQEKTDMQRPTWPSEEVSMQMHMDFRVPTVEDLERHREHAEALGATLLYDRSEDEGEPLYVLADPAGHPSACWSAVGSRKHIRHAVVRAQCRGPRLVVPMSVANASKSEFAGKPREAHTRSNDNTIRGTAASSRL